MDQDTAMGLASVSPSLLSPGAAEIVDGIIAERARLRACMVKQARMLARWAPQIFPANMDGQYHFARAMMESAAFELGEAAGIPEQFTLVAAPALDHGRPADHGRAHPDIPERRARHGHLPRRARVGGKDDVAGGRHSGTGGGFSGVEIFAGVTVMSAAWETLVERYKGDRYVCNCREAYYYRETEGSGRPGKLGCRYGCSDNKIRCRDEIAEKVVADFLWAPR